MDYEINKEQYKVLKKFENKKELGCSDLTEKEVKICEDLLWERKFLDIAQRKETYRSVKYSAYKINNSGMIAKECYEAKKKIEANSDKAIKQSRIANIISVVSAVVAIVALLLSILIA